MSALHELDWNLWPVLDALLETASVTTTARRLGRTQSAVSHSLAALRRQFGDPLFVRVGGRFEPTPRARELAGPVRERVRQAAAATTVPEPFDPARVRRTFRLFMSDYAQVVVLPRLLARLAKEAPGVTLDVHFRSDALATVATEFAEARLDVAVGPMTLATAGVVRQRLFSDRNVCVLRARHPALRRFTVERFAGLSHVQISARGQAGDFVDEALARRGLSRRIAVRVPHFATAPHLIASTDLVAVVPERIAQVWRGVGALALVEAPLPLPQFAMAQYFSEVLRREPAHAWLRRLIADASA